MQHRRPTRACGRARATSTGATKPRKVLRTFRGLNGIARFARIESFPPGPPDPDPDFEGRRALRTTFDAVADDYDRVRPRYPAAVFDDLVELAALQSGARLLEVGPGTGQATLPLAQRGFRIVAVELGERLAEVARDRLAGFPAVEIVRASFEEWEPAGAETFDAVVSFAAFHWPDPDIRYAKAARLLAPGGAIAIFDWQDVRADEADGFFDAVQEDYRAVVPEWGTEPPPARADAPDRVKVFLDASGAFAPAVVREYVWSVTYSADDYVTMLGTQSSYRLLEDARRNELFERIRRRIDVEHGGSARRDFLGTLAVARPLAHEQGHQIA